MNVNNGSKIGVRVYVESEEKINFGNISRFISNEFGFDLRVIRLKENIVKTKGLLFDPVNTGKFFENFIKDKFAINPVRDCKSIPALQKRNGAQQNFFEFDRTTFAESLNRVNIIITDKLVANFEDIDNRIHLRAAIFGYPSVISCSGIVEAPAKPKEYYLAKEKFSRLKVWEFKEDEVKKSLKGRFIDYHDRRLTSTLKGYIAQAIFFNIEGVPFCAKPDCRLFNAHWQEDLIYAQVTKGSFCKFHKEKIKKLKDSRRGI